MKETFFSIFNLLLFWGKLARNINVVVSNVTSDLI